MEPGAAAAHGCCVDPGAFPACRPRGWVRRSQRYPPVPLVPVESQEAGDFHLRPRGTARRVSRGSTVGRKANDSLKWPTDRPGQIQPYTKQHVDGRKSVHSCVTRTYSSSTWYSTSSLI